MLIMGVSATAQQLSDDLKKVEVAHKAEETKVYQVDYKSFESHQSGEILEHEKALYIRKGAYRFYMENDAVISVYDHGKTLLIDREEKKMMLLQQPELMVRPDDLPLDSLLKLCSKVIHLSDEKNRRSYRMEFDLEFFEYQSIELSLDTQTWEVKETTLFYNTPMAIYDNGQVVEWTRPRLEIKYIPLVPSQKHHRLLTVENYFRSEGSQLKPIGAYQSYELIDHTQTP